MTEQTDVMHTPGPWAWFGSSDNHEVYLATTHSGRRYVMGFKRWGMRGAQPSFQPKAGLVPAADLLTFEVGDRSVRGVKEARGNSSVYRTNISGIDCPDARLIAAAPDLLMALEAILSDCGKAGIDGYVENSLYHTEVDAARAAIAKALGQ